MSDIYLTFDAEWPDHDHWVSPDVGIPSLLRALAGAQAQATFFLQGKWVRANPLEAKMIVSEGHAIGLHSYAHEAASRQTDQGFFEDTLAGLAMLQELGVVPKLYRYPFGLAQHVDELLATGLSGHVLWSADSRDYAGPETRLQSDTIVESDVVLLHTWPVNTVDYLGSYLTSLSERGFTFAGITEEDIT